MTYHDKSLELLGLSPVGGPRTGGLPAAVAEWYARSDAISLLETYSNQDRPVDPNEFRVFAEGRHKFTVFMYENQGVCWWAFTDEGDDPPVYVNLDPPPNRWTRYSNCFSEFIYTRLFDFQYWCDPERAISGSGKPVSPSLLAELRAQFAEAPTTSGGPASTQYRFSTDRQRIVLWCAPEQTDWNFTADSKEAVMELFRQYSRYLAWHTDLPTSE